ncbi:hypothetical protein G6F57_006185 [Rhizopus arrhizus]|uniref:Uncharacterized protein n=1 Tax=Rhizopus oryzae TaxID=64495 RepID=A0A9P7BPF3_RHIOR|nr:hypothetical protein G6F23_007407 [Rhizopus arrhizus]KAG1400401.1 hypothetical protein G6F58_010952 [Rhizopus delemar]KAG0792779.1 hypothetical protein G6F21_004109 [Rhizopus arrhizus]KAG0819238.1 hypothetical protein G6F20_000920 [Rhizopus arrhizus]KAG0834855.1 hypothetical protein G6F19_004993 [Rhizopus arrhizus]
MSHRNNVHVKNNKSNNNNNRSFVASKPNNPPIAVNLPNKSNKNNHSIQQPKKKQNHRRKNKKMDEDDSTSSSSSSSSEESEPIVIPIKHSKKKSNHKRPLVPIESLVDQVYAGPTFNNAPAPSSLPLPPVFNARGSPTLPHVINTAYEMEQTNLALSEIQRGLRSMLKITS